MSNSEKRFIASKKYISHSDREFHHSEDFDILYVLKGNLVVEYKTYVCNLNKDDILIINPYSDYRIETKNDFSMGCLTISGKWIRNILGRSKEVGFACNSVSDKSGNFSDLRALLSRIFLPDVKVPNLNSPINKGALLRIIHLLSDQFPTKEMSEIKPLLETENLGRNHEIQVFLNRNYKDDIKLSELAEKLYLSNSYLSRYFSKQFDLNFSEMLRSIRVNHAADELIETDNPVMSIAMENGFSSIDSFARAFSNIYGISPARFRRSRFNWKSGSSHQELTAKNVEQVKTSTTSKIKEHDVDIVVDCGQMGTDWKKPWERLINIGTGVNLLQPAFRDQILFLNKELGFSYMRFFDIYSLILSNNIGSNRSSPDFKGVDIVLDFFVSNGIKPFIDLSNKRKSYLYDEKSNGSIPCGKNPFASLHDAEIFFLKFVDHLAKRYGTKAVSAWYFELGWPCNLIEGENDTFFDLPNQESVEAYLCSFSMVAKTFRSRIPEIRIGGGSFSSTIFESSDVKYVLDIWRSKQEHPTFISISCFPLEQEPTAEDPLKAPLKHDLLYAFVSLVREIMNETGFRDIPLHVSEFGPSHHLASFNDGVQAGAFLMRSFIENIDLVDMLGYQMATDLYIDPRNEISMLFGGSGLINRNGIPKPTFHAFRFLHSAEGLLVDHGSNYLITKLDERTWFITCCNFDKIKNYIPVSTTDNARAASDSLPDGRELLRFKLINVENGTYKILKQAINSTHGSIFDEWVRLGSELTPSSLETDYLFNSARPHLAKELYQMENGPVSFTTELESGELQIIQIKYLG